MSSLPAQPIDLPQEQSLSHFCASGFALTSCPEAYWIVKVCQGRALRYSVPLVAAGSHIGDGFCLGAKHSAMGCPLFPDISDYAR